VTVELERFSGLNVEGAEVDLLAIAGGVAPDVLYINFRKSDNYIRNNFLYPLDKPEDGYLAAMSPEEIDFRINPKLWPVIQRKGPSGASTSGPSRGAGRWARCCCSARTCSTQKAFRIPPRNGRGMT
jgi:hypothetical protein